MSSNLLPLIGCVFIALLCVVAYFPLRDRLALADFQSLSYGYAVSQLLPLFLGSFAIMFSLAVMYITARGGFTNANK